MRRPFALARKTLLSYVARMNRFRFLIAAIALCFSACAGDLTPEETDKPPAGYAPDAMQHIPAPRDTGGPRI
jgi:hypothetical protein